MRRLIALLPAVLVLATAAPALAATHTVQIRAGGFVPARVNINAGDVVRWTNVDTVNHQVVSDQGLFASPILRPRQSYSRTFREGGTFRYRDALEPTERGTIVVKGPPPSVSISTSAPLVTYGTGLGLTGVVSTLQPNETVQVYALPFGQVSWLLAATVLTGPGGAWAYATTPQAMTQYKVRWRNLESAVATIGVTPSLSLKRISGWWVVKAVGARQFSRRSVQIQRFNAFGQWITLKKVKLNSSGAQRFKVTLPRGLNRLRIAMSVNQAGVGYAGGFSKTILWRNR